jgi:GNAT superfamily N-acetyltransferase
MTVSLSIVTADSDIDACFEAFHALRPHLERDTFLGRVKAQQRQGYQILAVKAGDRFPAAAGFRFGDFLAWGRVLYIDDLTTVPGCRRSGHATQLLEWLIRHAREQGCDAVHLDTGYARHDAHRLYLKLGFKMTSHHLAITL